MAKDRATKDWAVKDGTAKEGAAGRAVREGAEPEGTPASKLVPTASKAKDDSKAREEKSGAREESGAREGSSPSVVPLAEAAEGSAVEKRTSLIAARGTSEGLTLRLDARASSESLLGALKIFIAARRGFLQGNGVGLEWVGGAANPSLTAAVKSLLQDDFGIQVREPSPFEEEAGRGDSQGPERDGGTGSAEERVSDSVGARSDAAASAKRSRGMGGSLPKESGMRSAEPGARPIDLPLREPISRGIEGSRDMPLSRSREVSARETSGAREASGFAGAGRSATEGRLRDQMGDRDRSGERAGGLNSDSVDRHGWRSVADESSMPRGTPARGMVSSTAAPGSVGMGGFDEGRGGGFDPGQPTRRSAWSPERILDLDDRLGQALFEREGRGRFSTPAPGSASGSAARSAVLGPSGELDLEFWDQPEGRIIYHTLRSGERLETEHSVVIFGDVNAGAEVVAGGDIIVLGTLRGIAHAGAYEESGGGRVIFALSLRPTQLRIGSVISRGSDAGRLSEGGQLPELARVDGAIIVVERYQARGWNRLK